MRPPVYQIAERDGQAFVLEEQPDRETPFLHRLWWPLDRPLSELKPAELGQVVRPHPQGGGRFVTDGGLVYRLQYGG